MRNILLSLTSFTILVLAGCGDNPKSTTLNWQEAMKQHKDDIVNSKPPIYSRPYSGYFVTKENELLIASPKALLTKEQYDEAMRESLHWDHKYSNYSTDIDVDGTKHKFTVVSGKLFIDNKRVYDTHLLKMIIESNLEDFGKSTILLRMYIANAIEPSPQDQALLKRYLDDPSSAVTLKVKELEDSFVYHPEVQEAHRELRELERRLDLSQSLSFKEARNALPRKGSLSLDNEFIDLGLPLFISLESPTPRTAPTLGTAIFKFNHQYAGLAYIKESDSYTAFPRYETSVVYGLSISSLFLEAQVGSIHYIVPGLFKDLAGSR